MTYTTRTTCRVCGGDCLTPLFSLGEMYVSDFPEPGRECDGERCPLDITHCPGCTAVQLRHTAPQELLYSRHYYYRSGVTHTMRRALRAVTASVEAMVDLRPDDVVLDIGSNDGTLLRSYSVPGIIRVGVEPATNLATAGADGVDALVGDFWDANRYFAAVREVDPHGMAPCARVVTAIGMMYDLEDIGPFVRDVARVLRRDGVFVAQLMCLKNMLATGDVSNICHEHLTYFTLLSLEHLLDSCGLEMFDLEVNAVNGQSYRLWIRRRGGSVGEPGYSRRLMDAFAEEDEACTPERVRRFHEDARANADDLVRFVKNAVGYGNKVWVYGASTKLNTLLQWWGLDHTVITAAADRSPEKWGRVTVGTGIPIVDEQAFRKAQPEYAIVGPWAFKDEFMEREREWRAAGGKFLFALPRFEVA